MKVRNFLIVAVLLITLAFYSTGVMASETPSDLVSYGQIKYANGTPDDPSDDIIIYDSDDLRTLETKIRALESRMAAARENLE